MTLSRPNSGSYYCVLKLDRYSIKSEIINITIDNDTTPTQPIITTAPPDPSVYTILISVGSVGGVVLIAFVVVTILLCVVTILYRRRGQNGYQQIPNGKIAHKLCHLACHSQLDGGKGHPRISLPSELAQIKSNTTCTIHAQ